MHRGWPVFWLAVFLPRSCLPVHGAQWHSTRVVRLTAAGAAPDWRAMLIAHVTGFPFHLPADEQEGTIHLIGRDSNAKFDQLSPHYFLAGEREAAQRGDQQRPIGPKNKSHRFI